MFHVNSPELLNEKKINTGIKLAVMIAEHLGVIVSVEVLSLQM
jgi:hypothetical protein